MGVARSRWLMGTPRSRTIVTRIVTTTYASIAASNTARPHTPAAARRPMARPGTLTRWRLRRGGRRDRDRQIEIRDRERDLGGSGGPPRRKGGLRFQQARLV